MRVLNCEDVHDVLYSRTFQVFTDRSGGHRSNPGASVETTSGKRSARTSVSILSSVMQNRSAYRLIARRLFGETAGSHRRSGA
jgi:hypothetical protein